MVINQISSDKIIATHLLYNRAKRTDINNETNTMEPPTSPYTVYETIWTVITAIPKRSFLYYSASN